MEAVEAHGEIHLSRLGEWAWRWLERDGDDIMYLTLPFTAVVSLYLTFWSLKTIIDQRRCARVLKERSLAPTAVAAELEKILLRNAKATYYASLAYFFFAVALYLTDIGVIEILFSSITEDGDRSFNNGKTLEGILKIAGHVAICLTTFYAAPYWQMVGVSYLLTRRHRHRRQSPTTASHVAEARVFASQCLLIWAIATALLVALWPVARDLRAVTINAAVGSTLAWMDASRLFIFHADRLTSIEEGGDGAALYQGLSFGSARLVAAVAQQVKAARAAGKADFLPSNADDVTTEAEVLLSEKTGL